MEERGRTPKESSGSSIFKPSEPDYEPLHIRLRPETKEAIEDIAEKEGVSQAEVVRELIRYGLGQDFRRRKIAFDVLEELLHTTESEDVREAVTKTEEALMEERGEGYG